IAPIEFTRHSNLLNTCWWWQREARRGVSVPSFRPGWAAKPRPSRQPSVLVSIASRRSDEYNHDVPTIAPRAGVRSMILRVLDPTNEMKPVGIQLAPRPAALRGKTVGFISN